MTKIYHTISDITLSKTIWVDGREVLVEFCGGRSFPVAVMGSFATDDKVLQQAIEMSGGYGIQYCVEPTVPENSGIERDVVVVDHITKKQFALEWIKENLFEELPADMGDAEIKDFLFLKGYLMINWK